MICENHGNRMAANNCAHCGKPICEECSVPIREQVYCKSCVQEMVAVPAEPRRSHRREAGRSHSRFLTLLFSFILPPGGNYMYLGLMKRGIFAMLGFFLSIYCITITSSVIFAFAIPVIWIASLFDALNLCRRMENGEYVSDNISDIMDFFRANKTVIVVFFAIALLSSAIDGFMWYPMSRLIRPLLVIAFGFLLVGTFFKKNKPASREAETGNDL